MGNGEVYKKCCYDNSNIINNDIDIVQKIVILSKHTGNERRWSFIGFISYKSPPLKVENYEIQSKCDKHSILDVGIS